MAWSSVQAVAAPTTSGAVVGIPTQGEFRGYALANTSTGSPLTITVYDNTAGSGLILAVITLVSVPATTGANNSARTDVFSGQGIRYSKGLWLVIAGGGTLTGSIFYG